MNDIKRTVNIIREAVNYRIYNSKKPLNRVLTIVSFLIAILAIGVFAYLNGFPQTDESRRLLMTCVKVIICFFGLNFSIRLFISFDVIDFIKKNWFEAVLILLLVFDGFSLYTFNFPVLQMLLLKVGIENFQGFLIIFIQFYMLIIATIGLLKLDLNFFKVNIKPSTSLLMSLLILGFGGGWILMMPEMTVQEGSMPFFEAFFTSMSAITQTGLIVVDTGSFYTFKGQIIIMLLIQVGALGIVSFGTFFGAYLAKGASLKKKHTFHDFFFSDAEFDTTSLFKMIFYYTIIIDLGGALLLFFLWSPEVVFSSLGEKIFCSLFHSVSSFCNAGFSLFSNGTYEEPIRYAYSFHIGIIFLVFLGSLGYPTLYDIFGPRNILNRRRKKWKKWDINSRISMYTALGLIMFGAIFFFFLESENTLKNTTLSGSIITSIFQSTTRTAGFNTVDISMVGTPMLIILCMLMFIGGGSGSVCGGIKTSTFFVGILVLLRVLKGKRNVEVWKNEIPFQIIYKVFSIFAFAATFVMISIFSLTITDPEIDTMKLAFEQISAFGTVGLSTGITTSLSYAGKIVIIISMFIGRVGMLTLAFSLSTQLKSTSYKYPSTNIWVG